MTTTNFDDWLDTTDLSDFNDVYSLYQSVAGVEEFGAYTTISIQEDKFLVEAIDSNEKLLLASDKARNAFLKHIEQNYCEGMDIEGYYGYHHAMEKDD